MWPLCPHMGEKGATGDREVARLAARQHGVVSTRQLHAAGLARRSIEVRAQRGRLHAIHLGVFAVGHPGLSQHGLWMAAVLACSTPERPAFLSHRGAAALWGLLQIPRGPIDVTVPGPGGRKNRSGVRTHRSRTLDRSMTTTRLGIPVTTPERTIADLRGAEPSRGGAGKAQLRRAIRQAGLLGLALGADVESDRTRSDLERDFLRLCRRSRLPMPEVNVRIGGTEADFVWRDRRVIVEADSYRYHRGPEAFRSDRRRGLDLRAAGFEVLRLSEEQVNQEPGKVITVLRRALGEIP